MGVPFSFVEYGRIAFILVELHLSFKQGNDRTTLGSKKVFQQKYHAFEGIKV